MKHRPFKRRSKLSKKSSKRVFRKGLRSHRNNRRSARGGFVFESGVSGFITQNLHGQYGDYYDENEDLCEKHA